MTVLDSRVLPVIGERIGRYEVLAPLATGGMGAVFVARLSGIGGFRKLLALKMLKPELADDPYFVQMFLDECRIVSQLSHRNVVQVFDVVVHRGSPCMVMEFLRGRPLSVVHRVLAQGGRRMPDHLVACVLKQAAEGLRAAHSLADAAGEPMQLVHRDISPDNLQICHDGAVKIVDFGIASTRARLASTRRGAFKGKVAYAAPEQIQTPESVDARADAWSLAVVAWELFTGRRLFDGEGEAGTMWRVIYGPIPALQDERPDLPRAVTDAVMAALERTVRDRAHDMGAFAAAMSSLGGDGEPALGRLVSEHFDLEGEHNVLLGTIARELESVAPAVREPAREPTRSLRWGWVAGAAIGLGLAGLGVESMRGRSAEAAAETTTATAPETAVSASTPVIAADSASTEAQSSEASREETSTELTPAEAEPAVAHPPTRRSRAAKKRPRPKRSEPASGDLFNNPYRQ